MPLRAYAEPAIHEIFAGPVNATPGQHVVVASYAPWYAVPTRYLFSGGYYMRLSVTEMRIDHVADDSHCTRHNRTFMISASYAQPIGNQLFSSRAEIPLFSADRMNLARLAPASMGDYVLHFSNAPLDSSIAGMAISARF